MIRRPPRSTLFPYTTLFRSEIPIRFLTDEPICFYEHTKRVNGKITNIPCIGDGCPECESGDKPRFVGAFLVLDRSEEHTSELQSRQYLVCRLLLEKKKYNNKKIPITKITKLIYYVLTLQLSKQFYIVIYMIV